MANKTRLDSLRQGERFKLSEHGQTHTNLSVDFTAPSYQVTSRAGRILGSTYVYPVPCEHVWPDRTVDEIAATSFVCSACGEEVAYW